MANRINITLNNTMLATLDLLAEKSGMNRSEYIRNMIQRNYSDQLLSAEPITSEDVYRQLETYM